MHTRKSKAAITIISVLTLTSLSQVARGQSTHPAHILDIQEDFWQRQTANVDPPCGYSSPVSNHWINCVEPSPLNDLCASVYRTFGVCFISYIQGYIDTCTERLPGTAFCQSTASCSSNGFAGNAEHTVRVYFTVGRDTVFALPTNTYSASAGIYPNSHASAYATVSVTIYDVTNSATVFSQGTSASADDNTTSDQDYLNVSELLAAGSYYVEFNSYAGVSGDTATAAGGNTYSGSSMTSVMTWTYDIGSGCIEDFDGDGTVDLFDYLGFVDALSNGLCTADINDDTIVDFSDYLDFMDAYSNNSSGHC